MNPFLQRRVTCPPTGRCRRFFLQSHVLVEGFGLHIGEMAIADMLLGTGGKCGAGTYFVGLYTYYRTIAFIITLHPLLGIN